MFRRVPRSLRLPSGPPRRREQRSLCFWYPTRAGRSSTDGPWNERRVLRKRSRRRKRDRGQDRRRLRTNRSERRGGRRRGRRHARGRCGPSGAGGTRRQPRRGGRARWGCRGRRRHGRLEGTDRLLTRPAFARRRSSRPADSTRPAAVLPVAGLVFAFGGSGGGVDDTPGTGDVLGATPLRSAPWTSTTTPKSAIAVRNLENPASRSLARSESAPRAHAPMADSPHDRTMLDYCHRNVTRYCTSTNASARYH